MQLRFGQLRRLLTRRLTDWRQILPLLLVSVMWQAATDLDNINSGLRDKISKFNDLAAFIDSQRSTASQIIEDNTKVRQRILDIIGE